MNADTTGYLLGGGLAAGGLTAAVALVAAGAVAVAEKAPPPAAFSVSAGEIAIIASLLGAVAGALGLMFRTLQAEKAERIKELEAQAASPQQQAEQQGAGKQAAG